MPQENIHYQHTQTSIALYCYSITVLYKNGKTAHNQCQDCRSNSINMYMRLLLSSNLVTKQQKRIENCKIVVMEGNHKIQ